MLNWYIFFFQRNKTFFFFRKEDTEIIFGEKKPLTNPFLNSTRGTATGLLLFCGSNTSGIFLLSDKQDFLSLFVCLNFSQQCRLAVRIGFYLPANLFLQVILFSFLDLQTSGRSHLWLWCRTYTAFSHCFICSPSWESVALLTLWLMFWKCFSQPSSAALG